MLALCCKRDVNRNLEHTSTNCENALGYNIKIILGLRPRPVFFASKRNENSCTHTLTCIHALMYCSKKDSIMFIVHKLGKNFLVRDIRKHDVS